MRTHYSQVSQPSRSKDPSTSPAQYSEKAIKMATYPMMLVTLGVLAALTEAHQFHTCCPTCSTHAITPLNDQQIQQVLNNIDFIQQLEQDPLLLLNATNQRQVVNLTEQQEEQMLRNFPQLFRTVEEFTTSHATSGAVTVPGDRGARKRRQVPLDRICQPQSAPSPFILVLKPNRHVVQIAQTDSMNQWILNEACDGPIPSIGGVQCGVFSRHVPALFINLSGVVRSDANFDFNDVVVQSCVTLYE